MEKIFTNKQTKSVYHVRIHPKEKYETGPVILEKLKEVKEMIYEIEPGQITGILLCYEQESNRNHIQGMIGFAYEKHQQFMRNRYIRLYLKIAGLKGNGGYSMTKARDVEKLLQYTLKEGTYIYDGIDEDEIKRLKELSYKKVDKKDITKKLDEIEVYLAETMDIKGALVKYCSLPVNITINGARNRIINMVKKHSPWLVADTIYEDSYFLQQLDKNSWKYKKN